MRRCRLALHKDFKLPPKDGAAANVGSPLMKTLLNYAWGPRYERAVQLLDQRLRPTTETDVWQREGPAMIWVRPLVAKRVSSFHKRLLWNSDMPCNPAYCMWLTGPLTASSAKDNHLGSEQRQWYACLRGMLSLVQTLLIRRSFESQRNEGCTLWTTWH